MLLTDCWSEFWADDELLSLLIDSLCISASRDCFLALITKGRVFLLIGGESSLGEFNGEPEGPEV
jgi:hypothetical protein